MRDNHGSGIGADEHIGAEAIPPELAYLDAVESHRLSESMENLLANHCDQMLSYAFFAVGVIFCLKFRLHYAFRVTFQSCRVGTSY